jgi:hypothetical protein
VVGFASCCSLRLASYIMLASCFLFLASCVLRLASRFLSLPSSFLYLLSCLLPFTYYLLLLASCFLLLASCFLLLASCFLPFSCFLLRTAFDHRGGGSTCDDATWSSCSRSRSRSRSRCIALRNDANFAISTTRLLLKCSPRQTRVSLGSSHVSTDSTCRPRRTPIRLV